MHALLPIHDKGTSRWFYAWVPICGPIAGGFMGGAFFKLYYEGQVSPWLFVSTTLAVAVLLFAWWANSHLYRAPSAKVIPEFEDTHATAAARAATYTPTGSMPVLLPEEVKANRSTHVVNRLADNEYSSRPRTSLSRVSSKPANPSFSSPAHHESGYENEGFVASTSRKEVYSGVPKRNTV